MNVESSTFIPFGPNEDHIIKYLIRTLSGTYTLILVCEGILGGHSLLISITSKLLTLYFTLKLLCIRLSVFPNLSEFLVPVSSKPFKVPRRVETGQPNDGEIMMRDSIWKAEIIFLQEEKELLDQSSVIYLDI